MRVDEFKADVERVVTGNDSAWYQFDTSIEYIPEDGKAYENRSLRDKLEGHVFLGEDNRHRVTIRRVVSANIDKHYNPYWIRQNLLEAQFSLEELKTIAEFLNQFVTAVEDGSIYNVEEDDEDVE